MHPSVSSHTSPGQASPLPMQVPSIQVSLTVQNSPSSQEPVRGVLWQPFRGVHKSVVHGLPSSQMSGSVPTHKPSEQKSVVVHMLLSSQGATLGALTHALATQLSSVHALPSSQSWASLHWSQPSFSTMKSSIPASVRELFGLSMMENRTRTCVLGATNAPTLNELVFHEDPESPSDATGTQFVPPSFEMSTSRRSSSPRSPAPEKSQ